MAAMSLFECAKRLHDAHDEMVVARDRRAQAKRGDERKVAGDAFYAAQDRLETALRILAEATTVIRALPADRVEELVDHDWALDRKGTKGLVFEAISSLNPELWAFIERTLDRQARALLPTLSGTWSERVAAIQARPLLARYFLLHPGSASLGPRPAEEEVKGMLSLLDKDLAEAITFDEYDLFETQ